MSFAGRHAQIAARCSAGLAAERAVAAAPGPNAGDPRTFRRSGGRVPRGSGDGAGQRGVEGRPGERLFPAGEEQSGAGRARGHDRTLGGAGAAHVLYARLLFRAGDVARAVAQYKLGVELDASAADRELAECLGVVPRTRRARSSTAGCDADTRTRATLRAWRSSGQESPFATSAEWTR